MTRIDESSIKLLSVSIQFFNVLVSGIFLINVRISVVPVMIVSRLTFFLS